MLRRFRCVHMFVKKNVLVSTEGSTSVKKNREIIVLQEFRIVDSWVVTRMRVEL